VRRLRVHPTAYYRVDHPTQPRQPAVARELATVESGLKRESCEVPSRTHGVATLTVVSLV
jgi:hypothetical protein